MDFSKFKIHDWLMIGGGAAMLILGFALDWTSIDTGFGSASGDGPFDYFLTGGIAWVLVVAVGVLALLRAAEMLPDNRPWTVIFVGATGLATILMVLRIVLGARFDIADRGIGMWGALVWSGLALAGAVMGFQAGGGHLSDLTDVNKLKESFASTSGGDVPPPPPPADPSAGQAAPPPPPVDPAPPADGEPEPPPTA